MKSREGNIIDADNLIEEVKKLAIKEIKIRKKQMNKKEINKISEDIAFAAIKFFMLKYDPKKDFIYRPKESINFEGETGPYVQYTAVRINSLLKKSKIKGKLKGSYNYVKGEHSNLEEKLIKNLAQYPGILEKSTAEYKPSLLCNYLVELSKNFNSFYQNCKILGIKDKKLLNSRLLLIDSIYKVLKDGLTILGIHIPQEM